MMLLLPALIAAVIQVTPPTFSKAKEPQIALDGQNVYIAYGMGDEIYLSSSSDEGKTFGEPTKVGQMNKLALGMRRGPRVVSSKGAITITAISHADGDLMSFHSKDRGKTGSAPVKVNSAPKSAREGLHAMALAPDGTIACTWLDLRDTGTRLYAAFSNDGGATWSENRLVYTSPGGTICECCHPSLAFDRRGKLHILFRNSVNGARDMYLTTSTDMRTFTPAVKLGEGTWMLNACPMDGGMLAIDQGGDVQAVWRREDRLYLSGGGSDEHLLDKGSQPWITANSKGMALVYQRGAEIVLAAGWEPQVITNNGRSPVVASSPTGTFSIAAWTENGIRAYAFRQVTRK